MNVITNIFYKKMQCFRWMCAFLSEQAFYSNKSDFVFNCFNKSPHLNCHIFLCVNRKHAALLSFKLCTYTYKNWARVLLKVFWELFDVLKWDLEDIMVLTSSLNNVFVLLTSCVKAHICCFSVAHTWKENKNLNLKKVVTVDFKHMLCLSTADLYRV